MRAMQQQQQQQQRKWSSFAGQVRLGTATRPSTCASIRRPSRTSTMLVLFGMSLLLLRSSSAAMMPSSKNRTPEASSTLLKMHRLYTLQPPHDASLYNVLNVSPNATVAEITKSYRKLTREYHPDKRRRPSQQTRSSKDGPTMNSESDSDQQIQRIREAYDVLKEDATRLPYHTFGLIDTSEAAFLLTGGRTGKSASTKEQRQLLGWMGYGPAYRSKTRHQQRVYFLAANLVEKIRPLVEGALSESTIANAIAQECDTLKNLPLGAQVLRCIGRSYRHCGQRILRQHEEYKKVKQLVPLVFRPAVHKSVSLTDTCRQKMRNGKQLFTAAVVTGRLVVKEAQAVQRKRKKKETQECSSSSNRLPAIHYPSMEEDELSLGLIGEDESLESLSDHLNTNEEIKELEQSKSQNALLETLQVEALWKISKIDLDRTIQEACNLILSGQYFFFPSHHPSKAATFEGRTSGDDGWVGSTGEIIDAKLGRLRAARALVLVGDVMVRCSKEGTSWME